MRAEPAEWRDALVRLTPRSYSISSSPLVSPTEVQLTVSVVRYRSAGGAERGGVARRSSPTGPRTPTVFLQPSPHFRPPEDADDADDHGGSRHRHRTVPRLPAGAPRAGTCRAATGCSSATSTAPRTTTTATISRTWSRDGLLNRLDLAFSRDQRRRVYVQHKMSDYGADVWRWLEDGAHFYVCGDATRMAKDVDDTLTDDHPRPTAGCPTTRRVTTSANWSRRSGTCATCTDAVTVTRRNVGAGVTMSECAFCPTLVSGLFVAAVTAVATVSAPSAAAIPGFQACPSPAGHQIEIAGDITCDAAVSAVDGYDWNGERVAVHRTLRLLQRSRRCPAHRLDLRRRRRRGRDVADVGRNARVPSRHGRTSTRRETARPPWRPDPGTALRPAGRPQDDRGCSRRSVSTGAPPTARHQAVAARGAAGGGGGHRAGFRRVCSARCSPTSPPPQRRRDPDADHHRRRRQRHHALRAPADRASGPVARPAASARRRDGDPAGRKQPRRCGGPASRRTGCRRRRRRVPELRRRPRPASRSPPASTTAPARWTGCTPSARGSA